MKKNRKVVAKKQAQKPYEPYKTPYYQPLCYDRTPYSCVWCDLKFETLQRVESHVLSSHQFNCNHCVKEIKTWKAFLIHCEDCEHAEKNKPHYKNAA
jgi:DNA-directed RNA polymerase subunit RPC12/RpoP